MQVKIVAAVAATLVLFGCAKTATISDFMEVRNSPFEFIDARPVQDRQSEILALSPFSCDYGIRRLGDEVSRPSKMDILHRDLVDGLGNQLTGKTVRVTRYAVYFNAHTAYATVARNYYGFSGGAVGTLASRAVAPNECTRDKVSGGWYEPSESSSMNAPTVVELEIEVGGKPLVARAVYAEREFTQDRTVILDAIRLAHAKLVSDLRMMTP
jgi:hypothetical protein